MTPHSVTLILPEGTSVSVNLNTSDTNKTVADLFEEKGYGLNTRCGGRGLCRGCEITYQDKKDTRSFRACQSIVKSLPGGPLEFRIPHNSWHDHTLHGVSCFDIRLQAPTVSNEANGIALALDIGTTTLAGALWNLSTGQCLADTSIANPQRKYGDNVISRISYSLDNATGLKKLQRTLVDQGLAKLIQMLCRQANCPEDSIAQSTIAGNPIMLHSLVGASLEGLSKYPFRPEFLEQRSLQATEIGLDSNLSLTLLPSLGPFVGADIVAGALASGMLEAEAPMLLIDFGTNGEILLKHESGYLATATAAGPAFEGGRLSCGASAKPGTVSSIQRHNNSWSYELCTGSSGEAKGISGAAYIDFLALGLESGLLNPFGRFDSEHPDVSERIIDGDVEKVVRFTDSIWISEIDVAELLQAKAAIGAGVLALLELANLDPSDLQTVFVAGGFGYHLNPANAISIGLLPPVPLEQVDTIGNAALGGASLLLQANYSKKIETLCQNCQIIELNQVPSFSDHYTDSLLLEEIE